jgi:His-Xaa-Ser system protein HxsD
MLHMRLMSQVAKLAQPSSTEITVDFDFRIQAVDALEAAAYRLIGTATCQVDLVADRFVCRLSLVSNNPKRENLSLDDLKVRFLNLVTDENIRRRVAERTRGVRDVILALAFGSLAVTQDRSEKS